MFAIIETTHRLLRSPPRDCGAIQRRLALSAGADELQRINDLEERTLPLQSDLREAIQ